MEAVREVLVEVDPAFERAAIVETAEAVGGDAELDGTSYSITVEDLVEDGGERLSFRGKGRLILDRADHIIHRFHTRSMPDLVDNTPALGHVVPDLPRAIHIQLVAFLQLDALFRHTVELRPRGGAFLIQRGPVSACRLGRSLVDAGADVNTTDANGTPILNAMQAPWDTMAGIYMGVYRATGLPFDADRIKSARPRIAAMLR